MLSGSISSTVASKRPFDTLRHRDSAGIETTGDPFERFRNWVVIVRNVVLRTNDNINPTETSQEPSKRLRVREMRMQHVELLAPEEVGHPIERSKVEFEIGSEINDIRSGCTQPFAEIIVTFDIADGKRNVFIISIFNDIQQDRLSAAGSKVIDEITHAHSEYSH
jgi:hypothetical protein